MKRTTDIFLLTVMLILTGCSKVNGIPDSEPGVLEGTYIFFNADLPDTKGAMIDGPSLPSEAGTAFGVFGFRPDGTPVFDRYKADANSTFDDVAKVYRPTSGSDQFTYDYLSLWHAGTHTFYAYYPYDETQVIIPDTGIDANNRPYITFSQPTTLSSMVDMMTAKTTAQSSEGEVVLPFYHRLFAFEVVLRNTHHISSSQPSETVGKFRINGADVNFTDVTKSATVYFDDGADTDSEPDLVLSQETIENISSKLGGTDVSAPATNQQYIDVSLNNGNYYFFIPCESLSVNCTLKYLNAWNEECEYSLTQTLSPEGGFLAGHKYALVIKKTQTGNLVEFVPSLQMVYDDNGNHWGDNPDINIDFN